jgi:hypothetical protein
MAAGFPPETGLLQYLLPPIDKVLVAFTSISYRASGAATLHGAELLLRSLEPFDPPIVTAVPVLLQV